MPTYIVKKATKGKTSFLYLPDAMNRSASQIGQSLMIIPPSLADEESDFTFTSILPRAGQVFFNTAKEKGLQGLMDFALNDSHFDQSTKDQSVLQSNNRLHDEEEVCMDNMLFSDSDSVNERGNEEEENWSDGCLTAKAH